MVHGCGKRPEAGEVVTVENGVDVCPLGKVHGAARAVAFDFDAEHPIPLAEVSNLNMLAKAGLEVLNEADSGGDDHAIVHMHHDDGQLALVHDHLEIDGLVNSALLETEGDEDAGQLLIPAAARLLEAVECFDEAQNARAGV